MTPKNIHKIFIDYPPKIFIFLKTPKNIDIKNFENQKMTRAYICMKILEYPPPPPPPHPPYFLGSVFAFWLQLKHSRRVVVSYKRKYVHEVLVITACSSWLRKKMWPDDSPDMTIAVDWGIKQQNKHPHTPRPPPKKNSLTIRHFAPNHYLTIILVVSMFLFT